MITFFVKMGKYGFKIQVLVEIIVTFYYVVDQIFLLADFIIDFETKFVGLFDSGIIYSRPLFYADLRWDIQPVILRNAIDRNA